MSIAAIVITLGNIVREVCGSLILVLLIGICSIFLDFNVPDDGDAGQAQRADDDGVQLAGL